MLNRTSTLPGNRATDKLASLDWYMTQFVLDPQRGYDLMNTFDADSKYIRKNSCLTPNLVMQALDSGNTRRLKIGLNWHTIPYTIAVIPSHRDGWAKCAAIDIDDGGEVAVRHVLMICQQYGLWAFAQLSTSTTHAGGHVYIPVAQAQPASLLRNIAVGIQAAAGVKGEAYPDWSKDNHQSLRLPLMMHLRAPDGCRRFPLLLASGEMIDKADPWLGIESLQGHWQPNAVEALIYALAALPTVSINNPQPLHKSKVNPKSEESVIKWYNDNYELDDVLAGLGVQGTGKVRTCPFHDDRSPSLAIWRHRMGHMICQCKSAQSDCNAASRPLDAFNLYCLTENQTPGAAVRWLTEQHNLGKTRTLRIAPVTPTDTLMASDHQEVLSNAYWQLEQKLQMAVLQKGRVTIVRATPGLGKTHASAKLVRECFDAGDKVAIAAPTLALADDWATLLNNVGLNDVVVWKSRTTICTCHTQAKLEKLLSLGYVLPRCQADCPYRAQYEARAGCVVIYQHNHLHLNHGDLLMDVDVLIVDESPLGSLLAEHTATNVDMHQLLQNLRQTRDPAAELIQALLTAVKDKPHITGRDIIMSLDEQLLRMLALARESPFAHIGAAPDGNMALLPKQFFGRLLAALSHDQSHQNTLLSYENETWTWYEKRPFLETDRSAAVIILDASANQPVYEQLCAPWPVEMISIDVPVAPHVVIVQCALTASTRKIIDDPARLASVTHAVAGVCARLECVLDGGISYKKATAHFQETLGGTWLHYGGLRGRNDFATLATIAVIASPTMPPRALERKAMALWSEDPAPIDCTWEHVGQGTYIASDPRLDAVSNLHGPEELRQAAHRLRLIRRDTPTTLLIFSPWDLTRLGLPPNQIVEELPYGNSRAVRAGYHAYQQLQASRSCADRRGQG